MADSYTEDDFISYCDLLAAKDNFLKQIITDYGYPPFWHRTPGYESLVRIILEQQVSLASALACFRKLKKKVGRITPKTVLPLSDDELRECGFSRQKTQYVKNLALAIKEKKISLPKLLTKKSEDIRNELITIKGIGHWTIDVYLLNCLHKLDIFPIGDLVLIKSLRAVGLVEKKDSKEEILKKTEKYRPYRSILSILLWHKYINENGIDPSLLD